MHLHIIIHESFEAPAAIEQRAIQKQLLITYTRLYQGDKFPENIKDIDFLIIMWWPQSPATTTTECPHFSAQKEALFIKDIIDTGKLVVGICLGAQMIGEALWASFAHSPNREIGVFDVTLTETAKNDPFFVDFPSAFPVGHRHGDMPWLTETAVVLATSEGCPRQIVRYLPNVYGFQCHFEFTPPAIEGMIANSSDELESYKDLTYIRSAQQLRNYDYIPINNLLFIFLDYMETVHNQKK